MIKVQVIVSYLQAERKLYVVVCCCFVTYLTYKSDTGTISRRKYAL